MKKIESLIIRFITHQTGLSESQIQLDAPFDYYGLTSSQLIALIQLLENECNKPLPLTLAWEYGSIESLSNYILNNTDSTAFHSNQSLSNEIAIVGMSCRFPGAKDLEAFWKLCWDGVDAITEIPSDRWDQKAFFDPDPSAKGKIYSRWGGFLEHLEEFDASFFGISPREAIHLDPRQRLVLETSWEALEDAGIIPSHLKGSDTGVFIATLSDDYGKLVFSDYTRIEAYSGSGTAHSMVANRISYFYDFHGPSLAVDTACSGSLVALHLAKQSLKNGECRIALAGGVNVLLNPDSSIFFSRAQALSKDGRCKTFDARADGFVRSEGVGIVVLKRLSDALQDNDRIYAVIKGSAINQDGRTNGTMAPSPQAQEAVLREAYRSANISPAQIQYIELHGTGTKIGDPIEAKALISVLAEGRSPSSPCFVGSVKTNIGHTEAAAGIAGVIKTALALYNKKLPGSLHFESLNPLIPSGQLPFRVNSTSGSWPDMTKELIAGVSSFGFGGTNGHVVLSASPKLAKEVTRPASLHVWRKKRYWIEKEQHGGSSLLGNYIRPIKVPSLHIWEIDFSKNKLLSDHKILGEIVFPGSGYIEMVLEALQVRGFPDSIQLKNIQFLQKMKLPHENSIQLSLVEELSSLQFEVHSIDCSYAKGTISPTSSPLIKRDLDAIFSSCFQPFSSKSHYHRMATHGLEYGPAFQPLDDIRLGGTHAIAKIRSPARNMIMICIDALFQLVAPLASSKQENTTYLPIGIEKFECFGKLKSEWFYGHATLEQSEGAFHAHLELLDPSGFLIARVTSLQLLPVVNPSASTYTLSWERWEQKTPLPLEKGQKEWMLFGKKEGLSDELKRLLQAKGVHVIQVENCDELTILKKALFSKSLNVIGLADENFEAILELIQACITETVTPTLCLITRGTQSVEKEPISFGALHQSLVWGVGRTAMHVEHPTLKGKLIDLAFAEEDLITEAKTILELFNDSEDQIVLRKGVLYRARLRKVALQPRAPLTFSSSSSYLITGGFGELGLSVAQWMCTNGARHLILLGLHPLPDRDLWGAIEKNHPRYSAIQTICFLESQGCEIETASLDVSDFNALSSFYEQRKRENRPKIGGVIHAAGSVKDAQLHQTRKEHIKSIFPSKIQGALNLFTLFKSEGLEFILFFSSLASILPMIGQGIYAAANGFLDAFVHYLRGLNIPAFSINWGPVRIGMTNLLEKKDLHARRGMSPLEPAKCWEIMGQVLQGDENSFVVASADWPLVYRSRAYSPPMIQEIDPIEVVSRNKEFQEQKGSLLEHLIKFASSVLQIPEGEIDPKRPLTQMGLDSLMATELKNLLATHMGLQIAISELLQEVSLEEIANRAKGSKLPSAIKERAVQEKFPLSYSQEGIWFLEKSERNFGFNIAGVVVHSGPFDIDAFYQAANRVIERQASLRTAFFEEEGLPYQKILPPMSLKPTFWDLSSWRLREKSEECDRIFKIEAQKLFDLSQGYLLRIVCVKMEEQEYRVLVVMHHLISDGISTQVLMKEVLSTLHSQPLPIIQTQYVDYALWQKERTQKIESDLAFWKETLHTLPSPLDLSPTKKLKETTFGGERLKFRVPEEIVALLKEYSKEQQVTPFMVLFAAYSILLQRYSGQEDFAIGVVIAGREKKEVENLIGCFINTLPIPLNLSTEDTFREFLSKIKKILLAAYDHGNVPFEKILRELNVPRDLIASPLFQAVFSFEKDPTDNFSERGIHFEEMNLGISRYNLSLELTLGKNGLSGWFDYKADLFERSLIERMSEHLIILLNNALNTPYQPISSLDLFSEKEKQKILVEWNQTKTSYPKDSSIYDRFFHQVTLFPESIALEDGERTINYKELNTRVTAFSEKLYECGIDHFSCVGLCTDRSIEMIIAILSLLRIGASYVPIDQTLPIDRIQYILQSAKVSLLLTDPSPSERLKKTGVPLLFLQKSLSTDLHTKEIRSKVKATDIACILYTSGSTGVPKGVAISHRNILRLVCNTNYVHLGPDESFLLFAPISFDASLFEIWGPLLNGGRLIIAPPRALGFDEIGALVQRHKISTLWLTAALFQSMEEEEMKGFSSLHQLLVGGDVVPESKAEQFLRLFPSCRLINGYGPTEGTTFSCCHTISSEDITSGSLPIGKPVANTQVYILDRYLNPTPIGVFGEIYIGGDGIVSGYLNNPPLTKERFVKNPFTAESSSILYRTGDRGYFLPDGTIKFGGRFDRQIKLRGFRIELEEIELHLRANPDVKEVVVTLRKDLPFGGDHLCAYIVSDSLQNAKDLKTFLKERLPDYMIPSFFLFLPKMPLNDRGKIDRALLPLPQMHLESTQAKGEIEPALAEIWKTLLHIEKIDRKNNFFELGGDSIRALQLVSLAKRKGLSFTVQDVFSEQTLEKIAAKASFTSFSSRQVQANGILALTPIQKWFFNQSISNPSHWNQWVLFRLPKPLSPVSLNKLLERHDCFRLRFRKYEGHWQQFLVESPAAGISKQDLSSIAQKLREESLLRVINEEQRKIDLENGPLFRFLFIEGLEKNSHHLLMVAHHLVMDQISWYILINEVEILCETPEDLSLAPSSSSFSQWVNHLEELKKTPEIQKEAHFWESIPWRDAKEIPRDHMSGSNLERDAQTVVSDFNPSITKQMKISHSRVDDFLVAVLIYTLQEWNGTQPICLDLEQSGRLHSFDIHHTIGWFTQIYPAFFQPNLSLHTIKEQLRQFATHGLSFGLLSENKNIKPRVVLNFLGEMDQKAYSAAQFGIAADSLIQNRDPSAERTHWIEINAYILDGQLRIFWTFSPHLHHPETIIHLTERFKAYLNRFLNERAVLSSDFPLAALKKADLEFLYQECENIEDIYPLTPLQEGLLLYSLLNPDSDKYLVQCILELDGYLNVDLFEESWRLVLERHPALRTSFHALHLPHPVQVVEPQSKMAWHQVESSEFESIIEKDRNEPFDLSTPILMRFYVAKIDEHKTRFLWTYHHILMDGWSMALVLRDLFIIYETLIKEEKVLLPPATAFKQYISALPPEQPVKQWKALLSGFNKPTPLPVADSKGTPCRSPKDLLLDTETTAALNTLLTQNHLTLGTFIQGIWALLLSHFSGEEDIVFGITVSGRHLDLPEIQSVVGLCINTVPQRIKIERAEGVFPWLAKIQNSQIQMQPYHHISLASIQEKSPLFNSVLVIENYPIERAKDTISTIELVHIETKERVEYPLTLMIIPGQQLLFRLLFDESSFSEESTQQIFNKIHLLISQILEKKECKLGELLPLSSKNLEKTLQEIWSELLGIENIGTQDHFHDLGGNSLSLIRMRGRVHQRLGIDIPLVNLFQCSTIHSLSELILSLHDTDLSLNQARSRGEKRRGAMR